MPTYYYNPTNATTREVWIRDINGAMQRVLPNETKTSDTFYSTTQFPELTKTLDTPYYNDLLASTNVTAAATTILDDETELVVITDISGTGDLFMQSSDNTPGQPLDGIGILSRKVESNFTQLVITTDDAISCRINEYKDASKIEVV